MMKLSVIVLVLALASCSSAPHKPCRTVNPDGTVHLCRPDLVPL